MHMHTTYIIALSITTMFRSLLLSPSW